MLVLKQETSSVVGHSGPKYLCNADDEKKFLPMKMAFKNKQIDERKLICEKEIYSVIFRHKH